MPVEHYIYDGRNILAETDEFESIQATYTYEPKEYGKLISQNRTGNASYYHYDALGSTRKLTDHSETITDSYVYSAWGVTIEQSGSTINPFLWFGNIGYYWDEETEDYYVRARYYQPSVGRWLSTDPLRFIDNSNLYHAFFLNGLIDPSGMQIKVDGQGNNPESVTPSFKTLAEAQLPCKVEDHLCKCEDKDKNCSFSIFLTSQKTADGSIEVELTFESHPGRQEIYRTPFSKPKPLGDQCFGDFGRTGMGNLVVDTGKHTCEYTADMFQDPGGIPIKDKINKECFDILSVEQVQTNFQDPIIRQVNGVRLKFKPPIINISANFNIEAFCGCGGFDDLGRPKKRNETKIPVNVTFP